MLEFLNFKMNEVQKCGSSCSSCLDKFEPHFHPERDQPEELKPRVMNLIPLGVVLEHRLQRVDKGTPQQLHVSGQGPVAEVSTAKLEEEVSDGIVGVVGPTLKLESVITKLLVFSKFKMKCHL